MIAGGPVGERRRPLALEDREEISRCLAMRLTNKEIAAHIERDESVVCREITRNGGREKYRAHLAQSRVGFRNSATGLDLGVYAARSYSLMRPPRTGRRLILSRSKIGRLVTRGFFGVSGQHQGL
jgi:hypothetical protein